MDMEGFNIKSSSFKIDGVDGDLYLTDFPDSTTGTTGVIKFFKIVNDAPFYVNNTAGTVDYKKGEIILFPISISTSGLTDRVEIQVIPESNDIVAKQNLYIVLDTTANSTLSLLEDVISSGSNRSGVTYVPPSSFLSTSKYTR
tara:strand:+ start:80 stop:508 length:429 start_codon:yes stop_codon:yes gene_type:complete